VPLNLDIGQGRWRIDLSVWLRDLHGHVADWHRRLRDTITDEQRLAVLGSRTSGIGSRAIPTRSAAGRSTRRCWGDGVRTPEQYARWLAANGFPSLDAAAMGTNAR
jgi:hypothetical protein